MDTLSEDFFSVFVQGQGDAMEHPLCAADGAPTMLHRPIPWATDARLDAVTECANQVLRSWVTGHSAMLEPLVWVENEAGTRIYEAWLERRRVELVAMGLVFVETPIQFWSDELRWFRNGQQKDAPLPMGYPMFEEPRACGCVERPSLVNPYLVAR